MTSFHVSVHPTYAKFSKDLVHIAGGCMRAQSKERQIYDHWLNGAFLSNCVPTQFQGRIYFCGASVPKISNLEHPSHQILEFHRLLAV